MTTSSFAKSKARGGRKPRCASRRAVMSASRTQRPSMRCATRFSLGGEETANWNATAAPARIATAPMAPKSFLFMILSFIELAVESSNRGPAPIDQELDHLFDHDGRQFRRSK